MARCLFDLHQLVEAAKIIKDFQQKFPEYASNSACKALKMDIKEAIDSGMSFFVTLYSKIDMMIPILYIGYVFLMLLQVYFFETVNL